VAGGWRLSTIFQGDQDRQEAGRIADLSSRSSTRRARSRRFARRAVQAQTELALARRMWPPRLDARGVTAATVIAGRLRRGGKPMVLVANKTEAAPAPGSADPTGSGSAIGADFSERGEGRPSTRAGLADTGGADGPTRGNPPLRSPSSAVPTSTTLANRLMASAC
jgi:hypothetical protein